MGEGDPLAAAPDVSETARTERMKRSARGAFLVLVIGQSKMVKVRIRLLSSDQHVTFCERAGTSGHAPVPKPWRPVEILLSAFGCLCALRAGALVGSRSAGA